MWPEVTDEERELEKQRLEFYDKVSVYSDDKGCEEERCDYDFYEDYDSYHHHDDDDINNNDDDDDEDDDGSDDEFTIEDFPELLEPEPKPKPEEIKPKLTRDDDTIAAAAADVDAVKKVLEGIIQSPASTKDLCGVHHLDQQILNKVLENLKNSITQETLNQLTNPNLQLAEEEEGNETASPVPLQAPPHDDKVQVLEQQDERKGKLTSYIPYSAAAAAVNNDSEEMTQLPASKKIRYAYDDGKSLKNLITQATSVNLPTELISRRREE